MWPQKWRQIITVFAAMFAFAFGCIIGTLRNMEENCITPQTMEVGNETNSSLESPFEYFLIILILSTPDHDKRRHTMRNTWLTLGQPLTLPYYPEESIYLPLYDERGHLQMESVYDQSKRLSAYIKWKNKVQKQKPMVKKRHIRVKHVFVMGTNHYAPDVIANLHSEQKEFGDLLLLPHLNDTYSNLTEKMLQSLEAVTNYYKFSYLLKVDDDTYVKLDELLNDLVSYDGKRMHNMANYQGHPLPELYWGYFLGHSPIQSSGKFTETKYFLSQYYITHALGGGYVISRRICELLMANAHTLSRYRSEDISMGTWLAPYRQIYRRHDARFDTESRARRCLSYYLVLHKRNDVLMELLYQGKQCAEMDFSPMRWDAYYYDWYRPADKCCIMHLAA